MIIDLNWIAIVMVAVLGIITGAVWYSPIFFGRKWMELAQKKDDNEGMGQTNVWQPYLVSFVGAIFMALVLALFVEYREAGDFIEGGIIGTLVWIGFVVPANLGSVLFEGKPKGLYYLNMSYYLVSLILMGGILAVW